LRCGRAKLCITYSADEERFARPKLPQAAVANEDMNEAAPFQDVEFPDTFDPV
jgi:hypothetical protein